MSACAPTEQRLPIEAPPVKVFMGIPHYGEITGVTLGAVLTASMKTNMRITPESGSLLAFVFNRLFCDACNERKNGITHFLMLHADVGPTEPGWVDVLLDEMEKCGADILSAVVPIKDGRGLTSTGWRPKGSLLTTRFTMSEIMQFPKTFDATLANRPDDMLMINTGCLLIKLGDWVKEFPGFHILDGIFHTPEGEMAAQVVSEDWNFAGWAHDKGLKVFATRAIRVCHQGVMGYYNDSAWGNWKTDKGDISIAYSDGLVEVSARPALAGQGEPFDPQVAAQWAMSVPGWATRGELEWLAEQARALPPNATWAEVGIWQGRSLAAAALSAPAGTLFYGIDTWEGSPGEVWMHDVDGVKLSEAEKNWLENKEALRRLRPEITFIDQKKTSLEFAQHFPDSSLDAVYIDGSHDYENALADMRAYWPKVKPGGLFSGHDANVDGVAMALVTFFGEIFMRRQEGSGAIWYARKGYPAREGRAESA